MSCSSPYGNHVAGAVEVTEAALVRDILYVFQGIDGRNIKMSSADNCYKVEGKVRCPDPLQPSRVRVTVPRARREPLVWEVLLVGAGGLQARSWPLYRLVLRAHLLPRVVPVPGLPAGPLSWHLCSDTGPT